MSVLKDFLAGVVAGLLNMFAESQNLNLTSRVMGIIPKINIPQIVVQLFLFGVWVVLAGLVLEKFMKVY